jgi:CRISPR-associated protein Csc2
VHQDYLNDKFSDLLKEVKAITANEDELKKLLKKADDEAKEYAKTHIKIKDKKKEKAAAK